MGTPQCGYGIEQARTSIYLGGGLEHQDHMAMNVQVLSNPLAWFYCNEQIIAKVRRHTNLEWDRLQVVLHDTLKDPKPTLIKLTSIHIFQLLGMIAWSAESIPLNMQAKVEYNKDLIVVIRTT
jgi:hypothetical protein